MSRTQLWSCMMIFVVTLSMSLGAGAAKVTVILPNDYRVIVEPLIPGYLEQNPGVEVELISPSGSYEEFVQLQLASGADVDLFAFSARSSAAMIEQGVVSPVLPRAMGLSDYGEFVDQYLPGIEPVLRLGMDNYYQIPTQISSYGLFYNKDHLLEAGLDEPPTTWEELGELSLRLTQIDGNGVVLRHGLGFVSVSGTYYGSTWPITFMRQAGIEPFDSDGRPQFSRPESIEAIDTFVQMFRTGRAQVAPYAAFTSGKVTLYPMYVDQIRRFQAQNPDLNMGTSQFPHLADGNRSSQMFSWGWFVNANSDNIEGAWHLASYLSSPETAPIWFDQGSLLLPFKGDWIQSFVVENPLFQPFVDEYSVAHNELIHPKFNDLAGAMSRAMVAAINGDQPTRSALEELDRQIAVILDTP